MTIGQLSRESNLDTQTIRYYERIGILDTPHRTSSNYRDYDRGAIKRLRFVGRAKEIGFSLNDIKTLIAMSEGKITKCDDFRMFMEKKIKKLVQQIKYLQAVETVLSKLVMDCKGRRVLSHCPVFDVLTNDER